MGITIWKRGLTAPHYHKENHWHEEENHWNFCAHLLQLGIQVSVGDVTMLLLVVGGFAWRGGLALGRIRLLRVGRRQVNCFSFSFWLCK